MALPRDRLWLAATVFVVASGLTYNFGGYPLLDPDEGRNAEVMREMAATNDYVLPRLNGLPYIDKPALYFVVGGLAMEVLGPSEVAARLPSLLFTLASLVFVAWFAHRLFGRGAVWPAVVATAATPFTIAYSRTVIFDSALTFMTVAAIAGFYFAVEGSEGANGVRAAWWRMLAWAALGLGVLTKGPIALALPLMIAVPYALWRRRGRALVDPTSVLLLLAIVLPWVLAMSRDVPGFLRHALVTETARRLTTTELGRTGPIWYFFVILPAAALPWSIVSIAGAWSAKTNRPVDRRIVLLLLWILVPLVFFSLSQSKRPQYILPLVPAVGLLVGAWWNRTDSRLPGARAAAVGLAVLGGFFIAARGSISGWVLASPGVAAEIPRTAVMLGASLLLAAAVAWAGAARRPVALLALSLPVAAVPFSSVGLMREIGRERSSAELAKAIVSSAGGSANVVGVSAFPPSLPFYLRRLITLATADGSELTSNYLVSDIERWRSISGSTLRDTDWWRETAVTCPRPTVFVTRADDPDASSFLARSLPLLAATRKYSAYGPCGQGLFASTEAESPTPNTADGVAGDGRGPPSAMDGIQTHGGPP